MSQPVSAMFSRCSPLPLNSGQRQQDIPAREGEFEALVSNVKKVRPGSASHDDGDIGSGLESPRHILDSSQGTVASSQPQIAWTGVDQARESIAGTLHGPDASPSPMIEASALSVRSGASNGDATLAPRESPICSDVETTTKRAVLPLSILPEQVDKVASNTNLVAARPNIAPTTPASQSPDKEGSADVASVEVNASIRNVDARFHFGVLQTNLAPTLSEQLDRYAESSSPRAGTSRTSVRNERSSAQVAATSIGESAHLQKTASVRRLANSDSIAATQVVGSSRKVVAPSTDPGNKGDSDGRQLDAPPRDPATAIGASQPESAADLLPFADAAQPGEPPLQSSAPSTSSFAPIARQLYGVQQASKSLDLEIGTPGEPPMALKMKLVGGNLRIVLEIADPVALASMRSHKDILSARLDDLGHSVDSIAIQAPAGTPATDGESNVKNSGDRNGEGRAKRSGSEKQGGEDNRWSATTRERRIGDHQHSGDFIV